MPSNLTDDEKALGKAFRAAAQAHLKWKNRTDPKEHHPPNFLAIYRHACPKRNNRSTAMQLKEVYLFSSASIPAEEQDAFDMAGVEYLPTAWTGATDRFGFVYKEGECRPCGGTGRSPAGMLVDSHVRPPIAGRVARSGA